VIAALVAALVAVLPVQIDLVRILPSAEQGDGVPLVQRDWDVVARVRTHGCDRRSIWIHAAGQDALADDSVFAYGNPGDVIDIAASARCGRRRIRVVRSVRIPRRCDGRALRVLSVHGRAFAAGRVLRAGDHLADGTSVTVTRGFVRVGEPECDGFRLRLTRGRTVVHGYRGADVRGRATVVVGDARAPGVVPFPPLRIQPRDVVFCFACRPPLPTTFAVRTSGRSAAIRVYAGSVAVSGLVSRLVVRAPNDIRVRCVLSCTASRPRPFQPLAPLTVVPSPPARMRRFVTALDPRLASAPRAQQVEIRRAGGVAFVEWSRRTRMRDGFVHSETGVAIWRRARGGWRLAADERSTRSEPYLGAELGDVTGDGVADVLLARGTGGSGGCGTRYVLVSTTGGTIRAWRRNYCEGGATIERGRLVSALAVGPCPYSDGSAHCRGGTETTTYRWNGTRLVPAQVSIRCALPRLDPAKKCAPR
jgi:hypothetical protein